MALTRFISSPNGETPPNSSRADPSAWAAAEQEAEQGALRTGEALDQGLYRLQQSTDKVDHLYSAQAHADISTQMFNAMRTAKAIAKPGDNLSGSILGQYDQIAQSVLKNSPNDKTREHLAQGFVTYRSNLAQHASTAQATLDDANAMQMFHQSATGLSSIVQGEPTKLAGVKSQLTVQANAMKERGLPATQVDAALQTAYMSMDKVAAESLAQNNPNLALQKLNNKEFDYLGSSEVNRIKSAAVSTLNAYSKSYEGSLKTYTDQLMNGQKVDSNFSSTVSNAVKFSGENPSYTKDLKERAEEALNLSKLDSGIRSLSIPQLENLKQLKLEELKRVPGIPPSEFDKSRAFFDARIKAAKDDPMGYASDSGLIPDRNTWPQISDHASIQKRAQLALQAGAALGVNDVSPLTEGEIDKLGSTLEKLPPNKQLEQMKALSGFGQDGLTGVLNKLKLKSPAIATAVEISPDNKDLALEILQGMKLKNTPEGVTSAVGKLDRSQLNSAIADLSSIFPNDPDMINKYISASEAVYAARSLTNPKSLSTDIKSIVKEVAGVVETDQPWFSTNPRSTLPDHSYTAEDFRSSIGRIPNFINKATNGIPRFADGVDIDFNSIPPSEFEYKPIGSKKYLMFYKGLPVHNEHMDNLVIDFNNIPKK